MKTTGEMSRMCLVTHRPTSVEPATMVEPGSLSNMAAKSSTFAGTTSRFLSEPISTRAQSCMASSLAVIALRSTASGSLAALP